MELMELSLGHPYVCVGRPFGEMGRCALAETDNLVCRRAKKIWVGVDVFFLMVGFLLLLADWTVGWYP